MSVKRWLLYTGLTITFFLGSVFLVNYIVDPLWMYSYDNRFNSMQHSMDDRQLKTNKFYFRSEPNIDTLLIGSSRTSYISELDFKDKKVFNFAEDNMCPFEMLDTIKAAKEIHGKDFETIVIGFDFFGVSKGKWVQEQKSERPSGLVYINKAKNNLYRLKSTLSFSTLKYSLINIKTSIRKDKNIVYDRNNIKSYFPYSEKNYKKTNKNVYDNFKMKRFGTFVYDENITQVFQSIIDNNPNSKFIVFTTPVYKDIYNLQNELGLKNEYKHWLKDLVKVFGEVYDFTGINSVNVNEINYRDPQHFDPAVGKLIISRIMHYKNTSVPSDFGIVLTKDNIDTYLSDL